MDNPKFINVGGIRTRYFEAGSGEPLVLVIGGVPGSYYSADHWSLNFDGLAEHFHVYAVDKLGQGFTDNPKSDGEYTMSAVIEHFFGFLRALDIGRATLLGHSRGALAVTRIAVEHPEMVKALIILDSATLPAEDPSSPKDFYRKLYEGAPPIPNEAAVRREPEANSFSTAHLTPDFVEAMLKIAFLPKTVEARNKMYYSLETQYVADMRTRKYETLDMIKAGRLKAPTLIIWGLNDASAPVNLGWDLFRLISSAVRRTQFHVFNEAGHYVFREHPREMNQLVVNFVRQS
ncbi:MAG: alpha/beta hydrolase [Chloroflexi bacterium]|nr:alpha/beta hydrolase [Chloroflexota bacterium]